MPAHRAQRTIGAALESLRIANAGFVERVLVVTSEDDPTADVVRDWARRDPGVRLLTAARRRSAGAARNDGRALLAEEEKAPEGVEAAPLLLFLDADCRLQPGGARALAEEMAAKGASAISARVLLEEGGAIAHCRHILEFKEAMSRRRPPADWIAPSTTLMCTVEAFDLVGGFPDQWPGEDLVFGQALRDQGTPVLRSRRVVTHHRHPRGLRTMLGHQVRLGRTAALARRRIEMPGSALARTPWLAPLLFPARVLRTARWQLREGPAAAARALLCSPLLLAGLLAWTAGFVAGAGRPRPAPTDAPGPIASAGGRSRRPARAGRAKVVAIVPVHNGRRHLSGCLESLLASEENLDVLVVDDASSDASRRVADDYATAPSSKGRVDVLGLPRNVGFAGAVNRGVARVLERNHAVETLVLVNQDCFVSPGWLSPLLAALDEPGVAIAGARLLEEDGVTVQHEGGCVEANGLTSHLGRGRRRSSAQQYPQGRAQDRPADVDYACGALWAQRASTWRTLGGLDEGYGRAYYEDVDYCRRARRLGGRVVVALRSEARHVEASTSGRGSVEYLRRYHRSRLRFVVRHHVGEVGWLAWLRSEAAWLRSLGTWKEVVPVLRAYARVPWFLLERGVAGARESATRPPRLAWPRKAAGAAPAAKVVEALR